jgi:HNH endonuclease
MELTQERLKELLDYDPETGEFRWKKSRKGSRRFVGDRAGCIRNNDGYRQVIIDYKAYLEHRLAWFYTTGVWPNKIDHKNVDGPKDDNRWCNLRVAEPSENNANARKRSYNKSGYKGVVWVEEKRKYRARITVNKKIIFLGYFNAAQEAHAAYCSAAIKYYGEFAHF